MTDSEGLPRPPRVSERAPEVGDFLQRPPHLLARYGTLAIVGLLGLLLLGAATYRYPITTATDLTFRPAQPAVISLTAINQPTFLLSTGAQVEAFQTLVVSQAGEENLGDVLYLEDQLIALDALRGTSEIGELSPVPNLGLPDISGPLDEVLALQEPLLRSAGNLGANPAIEDKYRLALARLRMAVDDWKTANTAVSPQTGTITIDVSRATITVEPTSSFVTSTLPLSTSTSSPAIEGQTVQIAFEGYPAASHGTVPGSIELAQTQGQEIMSISLRTPLLTSRGTTVEIHPVMQARATYITGERSLLSRIFGAD